MYTGWVSVNLGLKGLHRFPDGRQHGGGGIVVEVDVHVSFLRSAFSGQKKELYHDTRVGDQKGTPVADTSGSPGETRRIVV
jgi:hypothetical protein